MQKDSRVITDNDRQIILGKCKTITRKGSLLLMVHIQCGTAKYLGKANLDKTIVLFGSHIFANSDNSDAFFNLRTAFIAGQLLPKGVYILKNGKVFNWHNVRKDFPTGYFKEE